MNAQTVAFLQLYPPPPDLAPYADAVVQLPLNAIITIVGEGELHDLASSEIGAALVAAAKFNRLKVHLCAACNTWVKRADARPVSTLVERVDNSKEIVFYAFCPTCDRRIEAGDVSPEMASRLRSSIFGE